MVRFVSDSGDFGVVVSPGVVRGFYRFQLIVKGVLVGDSDECYIHTAMNQLSNRHSLADPRLDALSSDVNVTLSALLTDERLHDRSTVALAESMDLWMVQIYVHGEKVVVIAYDGESGGPADFPLISQVPVAEYKQIVAAARHFWQVCEAAPEGS